MMIPLLHFLFSFLIYEFSYSKNIKNFRKIAIGFQTVFWGTIFAKLYFEDQIFATSGQFTKISSATIYDLKKFCP